MNKSYAKTNFKTEEKRHTVGNSLKLCISLSYNGPLILANGHSVGPRQTAPAVTDHINARSNETLYFYYCLFTILVTSLKSAACDLGSRHGPK
jgi:hypothetical protein